MTKNLLAAELARILPHAEYAEYVEMPLGKNMKGRMRCEKT